jgi:hypothetical protein
MTDPERDEEFEAYLRRRSVLSIRAQSEEKLEPPDDLDDIVLRKARQAIQSPQQMPLYKAPRWALPVALAATFLLCLSVALNVSLNTHQQPYGGSRLVHATAPPAAQPRESSGSLDASGTSATPAAARAPQAAEPAPIASPARQSASSLNAIPAPQVAASAGPGASAQATSVPLAKSARSVPRAAASPGTASTPIAPSVSITAFAPRGAATPPVMPAPAVALPPSAPAPAAAPAIEPLPENSTAPAAGTLEEALVTRSATATRKSADNAPHTDPKAWLKHIDALRAAGDAAEADAELRHFRATFPAYPVQPPPPPPSDPPK